MTTPSNTVVVGVEGGDVDEGSIVVIETGTLDCRAPLKGMEHQEGERALENAPPQITGTTTETIIQKEQQHESAEAVTPPRRKRQHAQEGLQVVIVKLALYPTHIELLKTTLDFKNSAEPSTRSHAGSLEHGYPSV